MIKFRYYELIMQFINSISNLKKTLFSFEILPPFMGDNIQNIFRLLEYNPVFISLTFHLEEFLYSIIKSCPWGSWRRRWP